MKKLKCSNPKCKSPDGFVEHGHYSVPVSAKCEITGYDGTPIDISRFVQVAVFDDHPEYECSTCGKKAKVYCTD